MNAEEGCGTAILHFNSSRRGPCGYGSFWFEMRGCGIHWLRLNHHQPQQSPPAWALDLPMPQTKKRYAFLCTVAEAKACAERKLAFGEMALASRSEDLIQKGMFSWNSRHVWKVLKDAVKGFCWLMTYMHRCASLCNLLLLAGATFFCLVARACLTFIRIYVLLWSIMYWCFKMYVWIVISFSLLIV